MCFSPVRNDVIILDYIEKKIVRLCTIVCQAVRLAIITRFHYTEQHSY